VNLANTLKCFLISSLLLIRHTSVFNTADIKLSLSSVSSSRSYNEWSIVWSVVPQGHIGVSIILNLCTYDLMFPCPVTMHVMYVRMYVCMYVCMYVFMYVCTHIYTYTQTHTHTVESDNTTSFYMTPRLLRQVFCGTN
jgi:hypothetical protein